MEINSQQQYHEYFKKHIGQCILMNTQTTTPQHEKCEILSISEEKLKEYRTFYNEYFHIIRLERRYQMLEENFNSIYVGHTNWEVYIDKLQTTNPASYYEQVYLDINRRLINYLASLKSFIDDIIIKSIIPKLYGSNSQEQDQFIKKTREWYNSKFEYRFLLRLRDYAIHANLPLYAVNVEGEFFKERDKQIQTKLQLVFKKKSLLQNKEMKKRFKDDLALYNNQFPLTPILENFKPIMKEIYDYTHYLCKDKFIPYCENMIKISSQFMQAEYISIGKISKKNNTIIPRVVGFDVKIIDDLLNKLNSYR